MIKSSILLLLMLAATATGVTIWTDIQAGWVELAPARAALMAMLLMTAAAISQAERIFR